MKRSKNSANRNSQDKCISNNHNNNNNSSSNTNNNCKICCNSNKNNNNNNINNLIRDNEIAQGSSPIRADKAQKDRNSNATKFNLNHSSVLRNGTVLKVGDSMLFNIK